MTPAERAEWRKKKDPVKRYISQRRHHKKQERRTPEKAAARDQLQRALRGGRIERGPCFVCKRRKGERHPDGALVRIEAHHEDYRKPLEVKWVCTRHHRPPWVKDRG